jgi:hypothetical protein
MLMPEHLTIPLHAADGGSGHAGTAELRQSHDPMRGKKVARDLALGVLLGH